MVPIKILKIWINLTKSDQYQLYHKINQLRKSLKKPFCHPSCSPKDPLSFGILSFLIHKLMPRWLKVDIQKKILSFIVNYPEMLCAIFAKKVWRLVGDAKNVCIEQQTDCELLTAPACVRRRIEFIMFPFLSQKELYTFQ